MTFYDVHVFRMVVNPGGPPNPRKQLLKNTKSMDG